MALRLDPNAELQRLRDDIEHLSGLIEQRQGLFGEWLLPASDVDRDQAAEIEHLWTGVSEALMELQTDIDETEIPQTDAARTEIVIALQARAQAIHADAEALDARLAGLIAGDLPPTINVQSRVTATATRLATWVSSTLMPLIKKLLVQVWNVVSALITPKEWSIKGGIGTPLLGLANVELEITFGK